jgi:5-methylcytosine-specific restriction endonuclease McrBC regulatory subunit McrC
MLDDNQEAIEDFDKVDVLESNNTFPLRTHEDLKKMLHDYQGALKDLDKVHVLEPKHSPKCTNRTFGREKSPSPTSLHFT